MKSYIGCKIVNAELSNMAEYKKQKWGDNAKIEPEDENIEVYIILYPPLGDETEPYLSCSPKKIFEKRYSLIEDCEKSMIIGIQENTTIKDCDKPCKSK